MCRYGVFPKVNPRRGAVGVTHRALVGLLPSVSAHVNHQHVLSLEWLLLPRAVVPAAHKLLLLPVDVVVIDVLQTQTHTHTKRVNSRFSSQTIGTLVFIKAVLYHEYLSFGFGV